MNSESGFSEQYGMSRLKRMSSNYEEPENLINDMIAMDATFDQDQLPNLSLGIELFSRIAFLANTCIASKF